PGRLQPRYRFDPGRPREGPSPRRSRALDVPDQPPRPGLLRSTRFHRGTPYRRRRQRGTSTRRTHGLGQPPGGQGQEVVPSTGASSAPSSVGDGEDTDYLLSLATD